MNLGGITVAQAIEGARRFGEWMREALPSAHDFAQKPLDDSPPTTPGS